MPHSKLRIMFKAPRLALRSPKRFLGFLFLYMVAIISFALFSESFTATQNYLQLIFVWLGTSLLALVYAFLLTVSNKREIATLKCIGWGNGHVLALVLGELLFVSLVAFLLVIQLDIEIFGVTVLLLGKEGLDTLKDVRYLKDIIFEGRTLVFALLCILSSQVPGVILANYRVLRVRPIVALRDIQG